MTDRGGFGYNAHIVEPEEATSSPGGDRSVHALLTPQIYKELRGIAGAYVSRLAEPDAMLQPTMLLHEAFLRLAQSKAAAFNDEQHFCAVAATAMRQLLIDHLRAGRAAKRGGDALRLTLADHHAVTQGGGLDLLVLDDLLRKLERLDPRATRVVEMRFFAGADDAAIADLLGVSERTVRNDWAMAKAWLRTQLGTGTADEQR